MRARVLVAIVAAFAGIAAARILPPPEPISPVDEPVRAPVQLTWLAPPHDPHLTLTYQVEISDRPAIGERVLFTAQSTRPDLLFTNRPDALGTFTAALPPGVGLHAGTYFWHVRVIEPLPSAYSAAATFRLEPEAGESSSDLGIIAVRAGDARVGRPTPIAVTVQNRGGDDLRGAAVTILVDGRVVGSARIPMLAPGARATVAGAWTPTRGGNADVEALLRGKADDNETDGRMISTVLVADPSRAVAVTVVGMPRLRDGRLVLLAEDGTVLAQLFASPALQRDLQAATRPLRIAGSLDVRAGTFAIDVRSAAPAEPPARDLTPP
jgi:CARDB